MIQIHDQLRQVLGTLVPAAVVNEITCFKFYDNHPHDLKNLDVIICTSQGELKEYYNRELVCSTLIEDYGCPSNLILYRNSKGDLFYIVAASNKLFIFSRKETIQLLERVNNVGAYELDDPSCNGQACLKIVHTDDAVPLYFDENFQTLDNGLPYSHADDETLPIISQLMTKFREAIYGAKCNEKAYNHLANLRQIAAYFVYQENMPDFEKSLFTDSKNIDQVPNTLIIKSQKPWVKVCSEKIVIVVEVLNTSEVSVTDVQILLESYTKSSITYTTKIFTPVTESPFWREQTLTIDPNVVTAVVAVIDQNELQYNITSSIQFTGIISYKHKDIEQILPMENICISALDTIGEKFDVLSNITEDNTEIKNNLLAVLATTKKTDLCLRHIKGTADMNIMDAFCRYLLMKTIPETNNVVIRSGSPCHMLNGVMIVLQASGENTGTAVENIETRILSVYARSPPQVLALIHYIHDAIPQRIVVTTKHCRMFARSQLYSHYNEDVPPNITTPNYFEYGASILKQTSAILKYLDHCMIKMYESRDPVVQTKIGREIDVFVGGVEAFLNFRKELLDHGLKGVNSVVERSEGYEAVVINID